MAALTMRTLATRLGVVPGALYRHVRNKEQLHDLVHDGALAEVDTNLDPSPAMDPAAHGARPSAASRARAPSRGRRAPQAPRPARPHFLALAEAFLAPLQAAGFGDRQAGLASSSWSTTPSALRSAPAATPSTNGASATRRPEPSCTSSSGSLAAERFPALVALGEHVWVDNRDERFATGLDVLADGLEHVWSLSHRGTLWERPTTTTRR
jgi:AcrR family transcriptional regulator